MNPLTIELYSYKVSKMIIRVLQEDTMVTIGFEVERDVNSCFRPEGGECYVSGLCEGYGVPDVSCGKH